MAPSSSPHAAETPSLESRHRGSSHRRVSQPVPAGKKPAYCRGHHAWFPAIVLAIGYTHQRQPKPPMTWPALDAQFLADAAATFNFKLGQPAPLAVTRDGAVLFRRTPPREFAAD